MRIVIALLMFILWIVILARLFKRLFLRPKNALKKTGRLQQIVNQWISQMKKMQDALPRTEPQNSTGWERFQPIAPELQDTDTVEESAVEDESFIPAAPSEDQKPETITPKPQPPVSLGGPIEKRPSQYNTTFLRTIVVWSEVLAPPLALREKTDTFPKNVSVPQEDRNEEKP